MSIFEIYDMTRLKISPKFQIVIPRQIRDRLNLRPGQQITLFERDGIITAIPDLPLEKVRGILRGMSQTSLREKQGRL
jgi:AbrB family looped-hinge helix DNA binding protein